MHTNTIRDILPEESKELFDDIVYQRVLGASKHISMIGTMFKSIAGKYVQIGNNPKEMISNIKQVAQYFKETRGEASAAISNAIDLMIGGIDLQSNNNLLQVVDYIITSVESYENKAIEDLNKVVKYCINLSKGMKAIMVFDYSSTINNFLRELSKSIEEIDIYIPESRTIDGGYPFLPTCEENRYNIHFIPDAAIMYYLKFCDGAFFGAETFFPDGTVFNTTGSDIVALCCKELKIPVFVATPFIKVDLRGIQGIMRGEVLNDLSKKFSKKINVLRKIDFRCPELLKIESKYINSFITEKGIIPSNQLLALSIEFAKELRGGTI